MAVPGGSPPRVEYLRPLERAWARARLILFTPFDLGTWLGIGFAAWLANLAGGGGTTFSYRGDHGLPAGTDSLGAAVRQVTRILPWPLLAGIGLFAVALAVLLLWLSSRGKFVFLHDVVHDRAEIAVPWREYRREGDSLFLFRLALVAGLLLVAGGILGIALVTEGLGRTGTALPPVLLASAVLVAGIVVVFALVALLTENFAVPIMYRFRIGALDAWRVLLRWIWAYPWAFVAYVLFVIGLTLAVMITVVVLGLLTCCVGLLLLAIPYLGTVLTLPIWVTYRALGPEFLAQLHPGFDVFAAAAGTGPEGAPPPALGPAPEGPPPAPPA